MSGTLLGVATFLYLAAFALALASARFGRGRLVTLMFVTLLGGFGLHTAGIVLRWVASHRLSIGHAPLSNFYESLVFFAWSLILLGLTAARGHMRKVVLPFIIAGASLLLGYASFAPSVERGIRPLIPALKSNWLAIHVATCFLGYAAFVLASITAFLFLIGARKASQERGLDELFSQSLAIGFILFSFGIITGAVWAYAAWGRYWGWDPKETWALIAWLIYGATIHEHRRGGGINQRVALLALIGLACVLFTYIGVNYLPGLHSYLQ
jgi:ABC-type transport system involved in cytochrome c biogenesis permease subunit